MPATVDPARISAPPTDTPVAPSCAEQFQALFHTAVENAPVASFSSARAIKTPAAPDPRNKEHADAAEPTPALFAAVSPSPRDPQPLPIAINLDFLVTKLPVEIKGKQVGTHPNSLPLTNPQARLDTEASAERPNVPDNRPLSPVHVNETAFSARLNIATSNPGPSSLNEPSLENQGSRTASNGPEPTPNTPGSPQPPSPEPHSQTEREISASQPTSSHNAMPEAQQNTSASVNAAATNAVPQGSFATASSHKPASEPKSVSAIAEIAPKPVTSRAPLREIAIQIPGARGLEVKLTAASLNQVKLDVRSADPGLNQDLRANIHELVSSLEKKGFAPEIAHAAEHSERARFEAHSPSDASANHQSDSYGDEQRRREQNQSRRDGAAQPRTARASSESSNWNDTIVSQIETLPL